MDDQPGHAQIRPEQVECPSQEDWEKVLGIVGEHIPDLVEPMRQLHDRIHQGVGPFTLIWPTELEHAESVDLDDD
jgi:hypothetical protein